MRIPQTTSDPSNELRAGSCSSDRDTDSRCPVCEGQVFTSRAVTKGPYHVWQCGSCRFTWVDRRDLSRPEASPTYNDYSYNRAAAAHFAGAEARYTRGFRERLSRIKSLGPLERSSFLDVGCASGEYLCVAKQVGFGRAAGVEIDPVAAQRARAHGEVVDRIEDLSHREYQLIQVKNVLTNIADFVPFLESFIRLLAPEGVLWLDVLNQDSLTAWCQRTFLTASHRKGRYGHLRPPYVVNGFNYNSLRVLLRRLGMHGKHVRTTYMGSRTVPFPNYTRQRLLGQLGTAIGRGPVIVSDNILRGGNDK